MRPLLKLFPIGAAIMLFVSGCSRKSSDTANSQANAQANQVVETANPAPPAQPASAAAPSVQAGGEPNMAELDRVARRWMFRNRRHPTNFEDFTAHAGVEIPPPPPGKKYVLSKDMHISLVNQ
jgi:hypothetical protein